MSLYRTALLTVAVILFPFGLIAQEPCRPVALDKSEGVVKTKLSWAGREPRLLCQRG
jgi:hypothetical protein